MSRLALRGLFQGRVRFVPKPRAPLITISSTLDIPSGALVPDLSAGFDIPNPFGLLAADFRYDLDSYAVALKFLSDLAGGTEESHALEVNGGDVSMLRSWQASDKFRRVYAKCRAANAADMALRASESASEATEAVGGSELPEGTHPQHVAWEDVLTTDRVFSSAPDPAAFGSA